MTATEELRRMLDKRGVEWIASGTDTCWKSSDGYPMRAWDTTNGTHMRVADLTPAQAIAATLGGGKLTAEQVREAIFNGSVYASYDGAQYYANGISMQEIADELNAELGSRTCHMSFIDEYETASGEEEYLCECSECGYRRWEPAHDLPPFCSKCGRKVDR